MGFIPLSEPLVNVRATISQCLQRAQVTSAERDQLQGAAKGIFFKDRTYRRVVRSAIQDADRAGVVLAVLRTNNVNLKLPDARLLVETVISTPDCRFIPELSWTFEATRYGTRCFLLLDLNSFRPVYSRLR
ncbi:TfuA-like protein [Rhizobium leguminosarum]|uniref:TfuA-like protein n=1 Tax=Rhizobium leguminosarum TaxID=384 RepID=UPI001EEB52A9|nr:TfuA-like protein [Rhizobium leguminosarum]UIJ82854.1 hypothetical protein LZK78_26545 [Rhizobium leguminosarum]